MPLANPNAHGLIINVPRSYGYPSNSLQQPSVARPNYQPAATGYSSAHQHYFTERDYRARTAYSSWTAENIEIIAQGVFENGKAKGGVITVRISVDVATDYLNTQERQSGYKRGLGRGPSITDRL
jgi:hypothetical protein